jgi:SAM-dependent methyltransferase
MGFVALLRDFVLWNRRLSKRLTRRRPDRVIVYNQYSYEVYRILVEDEARHVLDVGAGRNWFFPAAIKPRLGLTLVGVDIDGGELAHNPDLDRALTLDACTSLGVEDGSVDLVTARAGVEHFPDNAAFLRNCARALKPGGKVVLAFAGRNAPFAVANRLLPEKLSILLLDRLIPDKTEKLGFKAHYDRCTYSGFLGLADAAGLRHARSAVDYSSSDYFAFFVPLFLLSKTFDFIRRSLGFKNLASYYCFVLEKPA